LLFHFLFCSLIFDKGKGDEQGEEKKQPMTLEQAKAEGMPELEGKINKPPVTPKKKELGTGLEVFGTPMTTSQQKSFLEQLEKKVTESGDKLTDREKTSLDRMQGAARTFSKNGSHPLPPPDLTPFTFFFDQISKLQLVQRIARWNFLKGEPANENRITNQKERKSKNEIKK
jgi:hypothetical protein